MRAQRQKLFTEYQQNRKISQQIQFARLVDQFIGYQVSNGNAQSTVKHYEQSIRKLERFWAYLLMGDKAYQASTEKKRLKKGREIPVSILDINLKSL